MSKVTVKDIARDLNLSVGTVYRSLNNTGRVSARTKKKVLEYAEQVGFQPNMVAQGLAKRKKFRIAVLLANDTKEWWRQIDRGIEVAVQELSEFGAEIISLYYSMDSVISQNIGILELVENDQVDGIILVPSPHHEIMRTIDLAKSKGIPVVCINADSQLVSQRLFYYGPDEEQVGRVAGEIIGKLIHGTGNVLLVSIETNDFYRIALRKSGLFNEMSRYFPEVTIKQATFPTSKLAEYLSDILQNDSVPDAIYVDNSLALEECVRVVKDLNLRRVAVVGHECLGGCGQLLQEGWISAALCQETYSQGYYPLKLLFQHLLTGSVPKSHYYSNVNVVFRSNMDLLAKNEHGCGFQ